MAAEEWHLDKRVNVSIIVALALQCVAVGAWIANTDTRLKALEAALLAKQDMNARLIRVEEGQRHMLTIIERIDQRLERQENRSR